MFDLNFLSKKEYLLDYCKFFFVNKNLEIVFYGVMVRVIVVEVLKELFEMMF